MTPKMIVKKKEGEPFAEISFSHGEAQSEREEGKNESEGPKIQDAPKKEEPKKTERPHVHKTQPRDSHAGEAYTASEIEKVVGVNPLTQKPIIKGVEKKPLVKKIVERRELVGGVEKPSEKEEEKEAEDRMAQDVVLQEMRKKQLQDITPLRHEPDVAKPRELSRKEAAELAERIWREEQEKKPFHKKILRHLGLR